MLISQFCDNIILTESVNPYSVTSALNNRKVVIVSYLTKGKRTATKNRSIEVYGYGLTKKGYDVIRVFQREGDTTTRVPHWKFLRLDRIIYWKETDETFDSPPEERYNCPPYNPNGDKTMSTVYQQIKDFE